MTKSLASNSRMAVVEKKYKEARKKELGQSQFAKRRFPGRLREQLVELKSAATHGDSDARFGRLRVPLLKHAFCVASLWQQSALQKHPFFGRKTYLWKTFCSMKIRGI